VAGRFVRRLDGYGAPLSERSGCLATWHQRYPNDPDGRSSRMLFLCVDAAAEIETPERAPPRDLPPPCEDARRRDEHRKAATTPKQRELKFFVLGPSNDAR
jgi:hypothetical protein